MTKEPKLALDRISSKLDPEEGKRRYCSFTKEERVEAEHLLCDDDTYLEDFLEKAPVFKINQDVERIENERKKRKIIAKAKELEKNENGEQCECDVIANIFQRAIKTKGLTKEEVQNINKKMLIELRKNIDEKPIEKLTTADLMLSPKLREQYYKYWDNKLAEDMQDPKLKKVFEEEDKIYKGMRKLEEDEYKKWEEENDRNNIR